MKQPRKGLHMDSVQHESTIDGVEALWLQTKAGSFPARYHQASVGEAAVLWVGGAGGGLDGPAGGLYPRIASQLVGKSIASLRIHYREPGYLDDCVQDTLVGIEYLVYTQNRTRIALVGHSFGGAVVITAGSVSEAIVAVVAMSSQTYGTTRVSDVSPRPLLLLHGNKDEVLPYGCSNDLYQRAREPKSIVLYPSCGHGLDECREEVDRQLLDWLPEKLIQPANNPGIASA